MHAAKFSFQKMNIERMLISLGMTVMEAFGLVMLICGIAGIKIF